MNENDRLIEHKKTKSPIKQNEKFGNWISKDRVNHNNNKKAVPIFLRDYVINLSSVTLSEDELNLLNKGLNFALPPTIPPSRVENLVLCRLKRNMV